VDPWLRLSRLPGIGPKTLWKLHAASAARSCAVWQLLNDPAGMVPDRDVARVRALLSEQDTAALSEEMAALQNRGVTLLHPDHAEYPTGVSARGPEVGLPPLLYAHGHLPIARSQGVAIVGSRTVEPDGVEFATKLASDVAAEGVNVVSGYARGVDMAAHTGALRAGGTTTIVLGLGILNFAAKSEIRPLLSATNTLVLSQFHPRAAWLARNAMARNKLVCALSRALVVVESGPELDEQGRASGTFDTAKTALHMDIPVFVLSPRALQHPPPGNAALIGMGCRELFKEEAAAQIREVLESTSASREFNPQTATF